MERLRLIAGKEMTYNIDINQHIESCRISIDIIEQKENTIKVLRQLLRQKDEEILELKEEKLMVDPNKELEIKQLNEIIKTQQNIIEELSKR